jgi:hypothetical protein
LDVLVVVAEDLGYLARPQSDPSTRTDVRLVVTLLRRLLVHGDYRRAWRLVMGNKREPRITARDPEPIVRNVPDPTWVQYLYAGGADVSGTHHNGMAMFNMPKAVAEAGRPFGIEYVAPEVGVSELREFTLNQFLKSTSIRVADNRITRQEVISYVANKLGGAHLDPRRNKPREQVISQLVDHGHIVVAGLPGIYFEVLSMASDLARSEDAQALVSAVWANVAVEMHEPDRIYFREWFKGDWVHTTFTRTPAVHGEPRSTTD